MCHKYDTNIFNRWPLYGYREENIPNYLLLYGYRLCSLYYVMRGVVKLQKLLLLLIIYLLIIIIIMSQLIINLMPLFTDNNNTMKDKDYDFHNIRIINHIMCKSQFVSCRKSEKSV